MAISDVNQRTSLPSFSGEDAEHSFPSDSSAAGSFTVDVDRGLSLDDVSTTIHIPPPSEMAYAAPEARARRRRCEWHRSAPFVWSATTLGALLLVAIAARVILACFNVTGQRYL